MLKKVMFVALIMSALHVGAISAQAASDAAKKEDKRPWYKRVLGLGDGKSPAQAKVPNKQGAQNGDKAPEAKADSKGDKRESGSKVEQKSEGGWIGGLFGPSDPAPAKAATGPVVVDGELGAQVQRLFPDSSRGHNDSSPRWAPGGQLLAIERSEAGKREILIVKLDGKVVRKIYYRATKDDDLSLDLLLPGVAGGISYNSGLAWSSDGERFVFMSNAGEGNYDLYLDALSKGQAIRITSNPRKDGQPDWSHAGEQVVFVSGREGGAQLFTYNPASKQVQRISRGEKIYLYPRWSPDGRHIAAIYGSNENHDIVMINDMDKPSVSQTSITTWQYDDLSPAWSPDGKKIAFYTNYNTDNDPKRWAIVVVTLSELKPGHGADLSAKIVAEDVIPDVAMGPAWFPDSRRIAYVRNNKQDYSPIYIVDTQTKQSIRLKTNTNINHDVSVSQQGMIAFRAQVDQWDHIFIATISRVGAAK